MMMKTRTTKRGATAMSDPLQDMEYDLHNVRELLEMAYELITANITGGVLDGKNAERVNLLIRCADERNQQALKKWQEVFHQMRAAQRAQREAA